METKEFRLDIKGTDDAAGSFVGFASTYGNVDRDNDRVERGAFTKTLKENGGEVPLLWFHDMAQPLGGAKIEDTNRGLKAKGFLNLAIAKAAEVYALLKPTEGFKKPVISALSIGYQAVKSDWVEGVRVLKEIKLFEVSLVTVPANPKATISRVKEHQADEMILAKIVSELADIKATLLREGISVDPSHAQSLKILEEFRASTWNDKPPYHSPPDPGEDVGHLPDALLEDAREFIRQVTSNGRGRHQGAERQL